MENGLRRVGLMGGTFDPIHNAHLALADCALKSLQLDEICFLPAAEPYLDKHTFTAFADRLRMTELAIGGRKDFHVSGIEGERDGKTYTADTLRILKEHCPHTEFHFILGADQLYSLESWHEIETIFRLAVLTAAEREQRGRADSQRFQQRIQYLKDRYEARIEILPFPEMDISSTEIRQRAAAGEDLQGLVPEAVRRYILEKGLYRPAGSLKEREDGI